MAELHLKASVQGMADSGESTPLLGNKDDSQGKGGSISRSVSSLSSSVRAGDLSHVLRSFPSFWLEEEQVINVLRSHNAVYLVSLQRHPIPQDGIHSRPGECAETGLSLWGFFTVSVRLLRCSPIDSTVDDTPVEARSIVVSNDVRWMFEFVPNS